MHSYWASYNNTSSEPIISQLPNLNQSDGSTVEQYLWNDGDGCVSIEHLKVIGGGHDWPGSFGNMDIDASTVIWNYVSQYNSNGLISCTTTSTIEAKNEKNFDQIYPNPIKNEVTIEMTKASKQEYQLFSMLGAPILTGSIDSTNNRIDLSNLPVGVYFLKFGKTTLKLIKSE